MQKQRVKLEHVRVRRRVSMSAFVPGVDACSMHLIRQLLTSLQQRWQREQALSIELGGCTAATGWHPFILFKLRDSMHSMPDNASDVELISQHFLAGIAQLVLLPTVMHCVRCSTPAQVYAQKADKHQPAVTRVLPTCQAHRLMPARPQLTVRPSVLRARDTAIAYATMQETSAPTIQQTSGKTLLCTSVTASTFEQALDEIRQISEAGADLIELRLDMLTDFNAEKHLQQMLNETDTPKLVTMRPTWEG